MTQKEKVRRKLQSERDVEANYGFGLSWLRSMRIKGGGIPFIKCGRSVRYDPDDVEAYIAARRVTSTTEAEANHVA